jgi:uncharacterized phage-associated protein
MACSALEVARAFVALCNEYGDLISNLKLQKLLYYAQGWHLCLYGKPLFDDVLEARIHGPVVPAVYNELKKFGSGPVSLDGVELNSFPVKLIDHVRDVWESYGSLSAYDLERLSHQETPWLVKRDGLAPDVPSTNAIDLGVMAGFFRDKAKNG